ATGSMRRSRLGHTATLLPSGKVLVAGGFNVSAELYDPGSGTWTATPRMSTARYSPTAVLLPSGKVLVAAGYGDNYGSLSSAELYDNPRAGSWEATGSMTTTRFWPIATVLPSGQVRVAGGELRGSRAELHGPVSGT